MTEEDQQKLSLREATEEDLGFVYRFVQELARFESLEHEMRMSEDDCWNMFFSSQANAKALLAFWDGKPAGFSVYYFNVSTFMGRRGLYVEDLYVKDEFRGRGIGSLLFIKLAQIARSHGCFRMQWMALDWNYKAHSFYRKLGSKICRDWLVFRLDDDALDDVAKLATPDSREFEASKSADLWEKLKDGQVKKLEVAGHSNSSTTGFQRENERHSLKELELLFELSQIISSQIKMKDVIGPILDRLISIPGHLCASVALINRDNQELLMDVARGQPVADDRKAYLSTCEELLRQPLQTGCPLAIPDISRDEHFSGRKFGQVEGVSVPYIAFMCVPIVTEGDKVGVLTLEKLSKPKIKLDRDIQTLLAIANMISQASRLRREIKEEVECLRRDRERNDTVSEQEIPDNMIGNSNAMKQVYASIYQVAPTQATVLIRGESGVGKELVAHAIHKRSPRSEDAYVKFNCAALPDSIIESELFGHEKGAFTGAIAERRGRFEEADGGTIFIDEIGDVSPAVQVKLLRVIQEREIERVGSQQKRSCDVRIIAATSRNLEQMMERGEFRSDLYYRLNVFPVFIPALRERGADILLLADYFVKMYSEKNSKSVERISTAAIDLLMSYHWPGNVRELENCIERAVILCSSNAVQAHHLPPTLQKSDPAERSSHDGNLELALAALEQEMLISTLKETGGNMAAAAKQLGMTERKMGIRIKKYDIDPKRFKRKS